MPNDRWILNTDGRYVRIENFVCGRETCQNERDADIGPFTGYGDMIAEAVPNWSEPGTCTCSECESVISLHNASKVERKIFCEKCYTTKFRLCYNCGGNVKIKDVIREQGYNFCKSCHDDNQCQCRGCDTSINRMFMHEFYEEKYCNDCFKKKFVNCQWCGNFCKKSEIKQCEHEGRTVKICRRCFRVRHIHSYDYKPKLVFYTTRIDNERGQDFRRNRKGNVYYGIELEVESTERNQEDGEDRNIELISKNIPDFMYAKRDSSLNNGFEFVSHPTTWQWLMENKNKWNNILNLRNFGLRSFNTTTCGMHIHVSKREFTRMHLYKFMKFFYQNQSFIKKVSQRTKTTFNRWSSFNHDDDTLSLAKKARYKNQNCNKYVGVNLLNNDTVEIRVFRGTMKPRTFWKNLEFVRGLIEWTRDVSIKELTIENFKKFIARNPKEYNNIINFLKSGRTFKGDK